MKKPPKWKQAVEIQNNYNFLKWEEFSNLGMPLGCKCFEEKLAKNGLEQRNLLSTRAQISEARLLSRRLLRTGVIGPPL